MHKTVRHIDRPAVPAGKDSLRQLLSGQPLGIAEQFLKEDTYYYDQDGWQYLLPALDPSARVLCLETRFGATVSSLPPRTGATVVVHPDESILQLIRHRLRGSPLTDVVCKRIDPVTCALPFEDHSFDAFIAHDVNGTVLGSSNGSRLVFGPSLLAEVWRVLKPDGFAYFGLKNRFGYPRLLRREHVQDAEHPAAVASPRSRELVRAAGFADTRFHPYIVEQGVVCEVLPPHGYRSRKNSFTRNERLKQLLLGRLGAPRFAPAFGLLCSKGKTAAARYERLAAGLVDRQLLPGPIQIQGFLPLPGKVIFSFGPANQPAERYIVVVPLLPRYVEWRQREIAILSELREQFPAIGRYLPAVCREFDLDGVRGFVLSEIPGTTIDRNVPRLEHATSHALDFLIELHRVTARRVSVQPATYQLMCGYIFESMEALYPGLRPNVARLDRLLRQKLQGRSFTLVWLHGDFKLENLILHPRSLVVQGVIDWELSRRDGLPLLDVLYLLCYNRMEVTGRDFLAVYHDIVAPERFDSFECRALDRYLAAIPLSANERRLLTAVFALHHVGCRYFYDLDDPATRQRLSDLLADVERLLDGVD